jgi:undecaprenyl-diphosphatase
LTEVLPISSSGHLAIAGSILPSLPINLTIIFVLHAGSLLAIIWWFRHDLRRLGQQFSRSIVILRQQRDFSKLTPYQKVPHLLLLSLLPTLILALLLKKESEFILEKTYWTSAFLFLNGLVLVGSALRSRGALTLDELRWPDYLIIGVVQGIAIIPGVSRLGMVLCAGLLRGLGWYESLRLSFLLSIPTIAGGLIIQVFEIINGPALPLTMSHLSVGVLISLIASLAGLQFLSSSVLEKRALIPLGYYSCMLGAFSFVYLLAGY